MGEVFALEGHAVLDSDATTEGAYSLDIVRGDGLGVVEKPRQAIEGDIAVDFFEHIEHP